MNDIESYIRKFLVRPFSEMTELEEQNARRNDIQPPVEPETGRLIAWLLTSIRAEQVLEIGTGNGYSALWICSVLPKEGHLITVEGKERLHQEAKALFDKSGCSNRITALQGNEEDIIPDLADERPESFDAVFQDGGKYLYQELLNDTVTMLRPGGILIADDTLFAVNGAARENLGKHTHRYNEAVFADKRLFSTLIPIGHGLTISIKLS